MTRCRRWRVGTVLLPLSLWLGCWQRATAQELPLEVTLRTPQPVETNGGTTTTLVFRMLNRAPAARSAAATLTLPPGWRALFNRERVEIAAGAAEIELVSIVPPRAAAAGDYVVRYEAAFDGPGTGAVATATVRIRERRELTLAWVEAPGYIAAGAGAALDLRVTNTGNTPAAVALAVSSALGSTISVRWPDAMLAPAETRSAQVMVRPRSAPVQAIRETLTATATAERTPAAPAIVAFQIIPSGRAVERPRPRVPMALALRLDRGLAAGFGSLVGGGALGPSGTTDLHVEVVSRDRSHPLLLEHDRYSVNLRTPGAQLAAGDQVWSLSRLTEGGRYGFGAGAHLQWQRLFADAFVDTGRRDGLRESTQTGGRVGVLWARLVSLSGQYLSRRSAAGGSREAELKTVRFGLHGAGGVRGDIEVGTGSSPAGSGSAASAELSYTSRVVSLAGRRARTDPLYPIRDRTGVADAISIALRPLAHLVVNAAYNGTERNEDPRLPIGAPTRRRDTYGSVAWNRYVHVGARRSDWTQPGSGWSDGWRREVVDARVEIPVGRVRLTPGVDVGREASPQHPAEIPFRRDWVQADVRLGRGNAFYVRGEQRRGNGGNPEAVTRALTVGGSLQPHPTTRLTFHLNDTANDALWLEGTRWMDATVEHTLPWGHRAVATYRRLASATTLLPSAEALRVEYVIPLGIPVKRPVSDSGRVQVWLLDGDTEQPASGLLVRLAGRSRLTDRSGVADFADVPEGEHYVTVEPSSLGPGRTVVPPLPLPASVRPRGRVDIRATVVRTATLRGVLQLFESAPGALRLQAGEQPALTPGRGVAGATLEILSAGYRRVVVTDPQGRFEFTNIVPGDWRLRVVAADVPPFTAVEHPELDLRLSPGEARDLVLRVLPKVVELN